MGFLRLRTCAVRGFYKVTHQMEIIGKISPDIDSRGRPGFRVDMSARV
jgi:hypothetical protein|tara:strand:- start:12881 stop:13024 length:144 start_codon:yes stop_codon:yes gene_type:complete